jgi:hypothetical protein
MILLVFLGVLLIAVVVRLSVLSLRRRRMAAEIRGDWWPRFEQDFRRYASVTWRSARDGERGN